MENTKETIIYQALTLFSKKGYEGVSMRDIANAVGIKASSLYNHFKSKQDIFDSIINEMSIRYEEAISSMEVPHGEISEVVSKYLDVSEQMLINLAKKMFLYFLKDDFASKFRKMLIIEQFKNNLVGEVFRNFFMDGPINFEKTLFGRMIEQGVFIQCDPYIMALHFYSPIFLLLNKYDGAPEEEKEALDILEDHIIQFSKLYH
ncbi:TetR/AcrR family transcriptional regulator [Anaerocolumna aminovalerica]|mgnify:CR=1 FL=1|jgi:AcrR family transcriptional regulator|uniref:TetR/AcrR family transcriptional regulator n=1 Tax=Anaerocolumna aminovalerica TaxID=1527 RepID=UPI000BE34ED6|nr:TetR/AcrR family transcriptional regulator [Anaerocolumna aminovalerica]MBU5330964.1 TetR/AcrR family transcriptional regulator [Anaerocolumna aminovalerica]